MKKKCHSFGMTLHEAQKTVNFIFLNYSEYDFASLITYQIASPHKPKKKKKNCAKSSHVKQCNFPHTSSHKTVLIRQTHCEHNTECKVTLMCSHTKYVLINIKRAHLMVHTIQSDMKININFLGKCSMIFFYNSP